MDKIITATQAEEIAKTLRSIKKTIVLAGGCFDILHIGHINFLQHAKKQGEKLFVLLESDKTIKKNKGPLRPVNTQKDRARILSELRSVDYIVLLPVLKTDKAYDLLVKSIKPAIIATTEGDLYIAHKDRQAKLIGSKVVLVNKIINDQSTSKIASLLKKEV